MEYDPPRLRVIHCLRQTVWYINLNSTKDVETREMEKTRGRASQRSHIHTCP